MCERLLGRHVGQLRASAPAEGPAGGGKPDSRELGGALAYQALIDRGVFAVHGQQLSGPGKRRHELATDHERLLVGERERLARRECGHCGSEARRAHESVQHHIRIRVRRERLDRFGTLSDLGFRKKGRCVERRARVGEREDANAVRARLLGQEVGVSMRGESDHLDAIRVVRAHVECLAPDRARRAEYGDPQAAHRAPAQTRM